MSDPSGSAIEPAVRTAPLVEELRAHPSRRSLGALALDLVMRQGEGRTQFVGREHVRRLAAEHGVERQAAATTLGNVLDLLERGPETARERALVCSLAVLGLEDRLTAQPRDADELVRRAVRTALWLEVATDLPMLSTLVAEVGPQIAEKIEVELAQSIADAGAGSTRSTPRDRARGVALASALERSATRHARGALSSLAAHEGLDPVMRAALAALAPAGSTSEPETSLEGTSARAARGSAATVLAWLTGWALLEGLAHAVAALLGARSRLTLTVRGATIDVHQERELLGRVWCSREWVIRLNAVASASRHARHRGAVAAATVAAMAFGILVGGHFAFDGVLSGAMTLLSVGAVVALSGIGLDLAVDAWLRARARPRVFVEVRTDRDAVRLRVRNEREADAFLDAIRARLRCE